jgi:hypothetical protein
MRLVITCFHVRPGEGGLLGRLLLHADQAAAGLDVVELGLVDRGVLDRAVHQFPEDDGGQNAEAAHDEEDRVPVVGVNQPAHQRCEDHQREILGRVENGGGGAAFGAREPGGDETGVAGEGGAFGQTHHEAHGEQAGEDQSAGEEAREALDEGEEGPQDDGEGIDQLGAEPVQQSAARDLAKHISPGERREDVAHLDRIETEVLRRRVAGDREGRPVRIVDGGQQEDQEQDQETHAGAPGRRLRRCRRGGSGGVGHGSLLVLAGSMAVHRGRSPRCWSCLSPGAGGPAGPLRVRSPDWTIGCACGERLSQIDYRTIQIAYR